MCVNPLVRYRLKYEPVHDNPIFLDKELFDNKRKGFKIKAKKYLESKFESHSKYLSFMDSFCDYIEIPCGRCIECRKTYARDWSVRCYHESLCHEQNCFITLTIDNLAHQKFISSLEKKNWYCKGCVNGSRYFKYPIDYSVNRGIIYYFIKRLRDYLYRTYNISIRYFGCGEYGEKYERPHYHILIFGYDFTDKVPFKLSNKGVQLFTSDELSNLWPYGFSYVEELNHNACSYVAQYCMKKIKPYDCEDLYDYYYGKIPEFLFMSKGNCQVNRCPYIDDIIKDNFNSLRNLYIPYCNDCIRTRGGLGFNWLMKYLYDVKRLGFIVIDGKKYPIPDYYKKIIKLTDEKLYDKLHSDNIYYVNEQVLSNPDKNSTKNNYARYKKALSKQSLSVRDVD